MTLTVGLIAAAMAFSWLPPAQDVVYSKCTLLEFEVTERGDLATRLEKDIHNAAESQKRISCICNGFIEMLSQTNAVRKTYEASSHVKLHSMTTTEIRLPNVEFSVQMMALQEKDHVVLRFRPMLREGAVSVGERKIAADIEFVAVKPNDCLTHYLGTQRHIAERADHSEKQVIRFLVTTYSLPNVKEE